MKPSRTTLLLFFGPLLLLALTGLHVFAGAGPGAESSIWAGIFEGSETARTLVWMFRLPKAATCVLAGAGLAVCGLLMQTLFRNPLAGPDVLGLSSGAGLMVAVVLLAGRAFPFLSPSVWSVALAASFGCLLVFLLMMAIAHRVQHSVSLLIVGLMLAATTSSAITILQYVSRADDLQAFVIWTMGSVGGTTWKEIGVMAAFIATGLLIAATQTKALNTWVLGETYAQSLGIRLTHTRIMTMLATSLVAGAITAFCGPISFVGLAVPHIVRLALPSLHHQKLVPIVAMAGSCLLLSCDLLSQWPGSTQRLPLNAITALFGAPVVIWVVVRAKKIAF